MTTTTKTNPSDLARKEAAAAVIYERSGIGTRVGFGNHPALIVVDFQNGFTDPDSLVGGDLSAPIAATRTLLDEFRRRGWPVAFTAVGFDVSGRDGATWLKKVPGLTFLDETSAWCHIDQRLAPIPGEPVWVKRAPSAFFGTPLITFLTAARVDTVVVVGCVTSGCIRATTIDAISYGYRAIVPRECVADRAEGPHIWNLFDIDAKYADVEPLARVFEQLAEIK